MAIIYSEEAGCKNFFEIPRFYHYMVTSMEISMDI